MFILDRRGGGLVRWLGLFVCRRGCPIRQVKRHSRGSEFFLVYHKRGAMSNLFLFFGGIFLKIVGDGFPDFARKEKKSGKIRDCHKTVKHIGKRPDLCDGEKDPKSGKKDEGGAIEFCRVFSKEENDAFFSVEGPSQQGGKSKKGETPPYEKG